MSSARLNNLVSAVLVLCAVTVTGLVVRRELFGSRAAAAPPPVRVVENWREAASGESLMGEPDAPVRIIEFSDFQCPFCASASTALREIREKHPGKVTVLYKHFPLDRIHPHARAAAAASECAREQGRFEAFHDVLFARQKEIGSVPWTRLAAEAAVPDTAAFRACAESGRFAAVVARDAEQGEKVGVQATPAFLYRGKMVTGTTGLDSLRNWVARDLAGR